MHFSVAVHLKRYEEAIEWSVKMFRAVWGHCFAQPSSSLSLSPSLAPLLSASSSTSSSQTLLGSGTVSGTVSGTGSGTVSGTGSGTVSGTVSGLGVVTVSGSGTGSGTGSGILPPIEVEGWEELLSVIKEIFKIVTTSETLYEFVLPKLRNLIDEINSEKIINEKINEKQKNSLRGNGFQAALMVVKSCKELLSDLRVSYGGFCLKKLKVRYDISYPILSQRGI